MATTTNVLTHEGRILNWRNEDQGSAVFISAHHALIVSSKFQDDEGFVCAGGTKRVGYMIINGQVDPCPSHRREYKILYVAHPGKVEQTACPNEILYSLIDINQHHFNPAIQRLAWEVLQALPVPPPAVEEHVAISLPPVALAPPPSRTPSDLYLWTDLAGGKQASEKGILSSSKEVRAFVVMSKGAALRCGASFSYDRVIQIATEKPTMEGPLLSAGGHWQYRITSSIPQEAITLYSPLTQR